MILESFNTQHTFNFALELGKNSSAGQVYALTGDLSAGKTVFAKGFAKGLGISEDITSPTFSIVNIYNIGRLNLYHFDVYRINHISEMDDTGYEDYFYGDGVCLVEWAELVKDILPKNTIWISISKDYTKNDDYRKIIIQKF